MTLIEGGAVGLSSRLAARSISCKGGRGRKGSERFVRQRVIGSPAARHCRELGSTHPEWAGRGRCDRPRPPAALGLASAPRRAPRTPVVERHGMTKTDPTERVLETGANAVAARRLVGLLRAAALAGGRHDPDL